MQSALGSTMYALCGANLITDQSLLSIALEHLMLKNSKGARKIGLKFDTNKEDSLNYRSKEIKHLKTDLVFPIDDDDVIFPCSSVELAFSGWQSAPDTTVGFVPRMHWLDESERFLRLVQLESAAWEVTARK